MWVNGESVGFVYIIEVIPKDRWGNLLMRKRRFYTGYTGRAIDIRYSEHIRKIASNYMKRNFPNSRKKLSYVEVVNYIPKDELPYFRVGNKKIPYHPREYEIKRMSKDEKVRLIKSERNMLLNFKPNFGRPVVILRNGWMFYDGKVKVIEEKLNMATNYYQY